MELDKKIERLKEITALLDKPDLSLDEGLKLFEEGSKIAKECYQALNDVKGKISVIKKDIDTFKEEDM